jgi:hypothetical protein
MKIWFGHGTEHSANLVMIGRFVDVKDARKASELISTLTDRVQAEERAGTLKLGDPPDKFSDEMLDFLLKSNVVSLGPGELEQFIYDVKIDVSGKEIVLTTDEVEISAFLKIFIDHGARIELFSAHHHRDTGYGR